LFARLEQERWNRSHEHRFGYALRSVLTQVARHLAATHRETDQRGFTQVEPGHQLVEVRGEGVEVVARRRLAGSSEAPAVVRDDSVTCSEQGPDLLLPGCAAQRPSMDQHDRPTRAVVLVVELDGLGVFLANNERAHHTSPYVLRMNVTFKAEGGRQRLDLMLGERF
jgi:hypothetical protein